MSPSLIGAPNKEKRDEPKLKLNKTSVIDRQPESIDNIFLPPSCRYPEGNREESSHPSRKPVSNDPMKNIKEPITSVSPHAVRRSKPESGAIPKRMRDTERLPEKIIQPPSLQVMPNRETTKIENNGRGPIGEPKNQHASDKTHQCPVCEMDFPLGWSDDYATQHVNHHFN